MALEYLYIAPDFAPQLRVKERSLSHGVEEWRSRGSILSRTRIGPLRLHGSSFLMDMNSGQVGRVRDQRSITGSVILQKQIATWLPGRPDSIFKP